MYPRALIVVVAALALAGCGSGPDAGDVAGEGTEPPEAADTPEPDVAAGDTPGGDAAGDVSHDSAGTVDEADDADPATLRVELGLADGWHEADREQLAELAGMGPATVFTNDDACDDGRCPYVYALVVSAPVDDPRDYHDLSRGEVEERLGAEIVEEGEVDIDGHDGYELVYDLDAEDGRQRQLLRQTVVGGDAVVIAYLAHRRELFEDWRADGEAMLESAQVIEAE